MAMPNSKLTGRGTLGVLSAVSVSNARLAAPSAARFDTVYVTVCGCRLHENSTCVWLRKCLHVCVCVWLRKQLKSQLKGTAWLSAVSSQNGRVHVAVPAGPTINLSLVACHHR